MKKRISVLVILAVVLLIGFALFLLFSEKKVLLSPEEGLVAHYKFEGNANDETGVNNGMWVGNAAYVTGINGQAAKFDGAGDYINISDSPSLRLGDKYTISVWIKPSQLPPWIYTILKPILEKGPGESRYMFWLNGDELGAIGHKESPNTASTDANILIDEWSHLICAFDYNANPQTRCWRNGAELSLTGNTGIGHTPISDNILKIASATSQYPAYYFSGLIDEIKIWNRALSENEVIGEYNSNVVDYYLCSELDTYDGTQDDVSSVIQNCISKVKVRGVLELPAGKYYIDKQIKVRNPITFRTQGKTEQTAQCSLDDASCAEIIAGLGLTELWGLLTVDSDNVNLDHIILNGNKENRWNSAAGDNVRGGNSSIGHNLMLLDCSNCKFTNNVLKNGLAATAFGYGYGLKPLDNHNTLISNNIIAYNGMHTPELGSFLWSDGLSIHDGDSLTITNNEFIDNTDIDFIIGGCTNCIIQNNRFTHTGTISGGSFAALNLVAWYNATRIQISTGDFTGTDVSGNTIDCSVNKRCGFGIYLGSDAWGFPELSIAGGSVHNNIIRNAQQGFNVDKVQNMEVYDNFVYDSGGIFGANKKTSTNDLVPVFNYRDMGSYNIDSDSVVDRSLDSVPDSAYTHEQWGDPATGYWEIPNWFTDETCNMNDVCEAGETAVYCAGDCVSEYVAYYKFDGNANDETGVNNGNLVGDVNFVAGIVEQAASFNGRSYVQIDDSASINFKGNVTISAWIKFSSLQTPVTGLVERMNANSPYLGVELGIHNNLAAFHAGGTYASNLLVGSKVINDNNWHYVVGVYNETSSLIYVDGVLDIASIRTNNIQVSNEKLNIGTDYNNKLNFSGLIDEVKIWDRALSTNEVLNEYNSISNWNMPACLANLDCGIDEWIGTSTCSNDDVWQGWRTYTCNNPGTSQASCSYSDNLQLKQDCGIDSCEGFGANYCKNNDVYHSRTCNDRGCSNSACFDNSYTEEQLVQACGSAICENANCNIISFTGEYYNNKYLTGSPVLIRQDSIINFSWGYGSPAAGINKDLFSVRWTKNEFLSGKYDFVVRVDDGVRLYIDNQLIIDKWKNQSPTTYNVTINLNSGAHQIKMEYYENTGGAVANLTWRKI